jgi:NADPH:quinone reductase-like Zn-dependent oxidoreductase
MKAVIMNEYGSPDVLKVEERPIPQPQAGEVLVKIIGSSINLIDWKLRSGQLKHFLRIELPAILGFDICGVVAQVGPGVSDFKVGDEVYTLSAKKSGESYAEYISLPATSLHHKPTKMTALEAATVPLAAQTALQGLRKGVSNLDNKNVLIIGASGGVGTFAVQIAKAFGAKVTGVASTKNREYVLSLGADQFIDYTTTDIRASSEKYDFIFDTVSQYQLGPVKRILTPTGVYVRTLPSVPLMIRQLLNGFAHHKAFLVLVKNNANDLKWLATAIDNGQIKTHIDSQFTLHQISEAHQRSESHRVVGKIAISITH